MPRVKIEGVSQADNGKRCLLTHLEVSTDNPRAAIDPVWYEELKAQIAAHGGVKRPLDCRVKPDKSGLVIHDGGHRFKAAQELGYESVPVMIMQGNELDHILASGTGEGKPLDIVDQVRWVQLCLNAGATQGQIATTRGVSEGWVVTRVKLIPLSEEARVALRSGEITIGKARSMAKHSELDQKDELEKIRKAKENGSSKAGSLAPKRPGIKTCRKWSERIETAPGISQTQIEAFKDGLAFALGELPVGEMAEKYGILEDEG